MAGISLNRAARNRLRTVAVWAMLPLALFNSRTVYGCGCTGHFESTCHCNCCISPNSKCGKCGGQGTSTCPCCSKVQKSATTENGKSSDTSTGFHGHHCKRIAAHEVIPATVVTVHAGDEVNLTALDFVTIDLPIVANQLVYQHNASAYLVAPPNDLVVTLHRLVI